MKQQYYFCSLIFLFTLILCMTESDIYARDKKTVINKMALWDNKDGTHLRGMCLYQRRTYPEWDNDSNGSGFVGPPFTQEELNKLSKLGANWVDISHPGLYNEKPPYKLNKEIQANLDKLLDMVKKAGMYATITFRTGPGRSEFSFIGGEDEDSFVKEHINNEVWKSKEAQNAWAHMWKYTAGRYKDNPTVAGYKLMCEPNAEAVIFDIYQPEEFYPRYENTTYDWNQFYPKIISAIRAVDSDTPILLSPMGWGGVRWLPYLKPSKEKNIVYTFHQYEPHIYTHQETGGKYSYPEIFDINGDGFNENFNKKWLGELLSVADEFARKNGAILAVGESGIQRWVPNAHQFVNDQLNLFEERGFNYVMWDWNSKFRIEKCPGNDSFSLLNGPDPENHREVSNKLLDVVLKHWGKNRIKNNDTEKADLK